MGLEGSPGPPWGQQIPGGSVAWRVWLEMLKVEPVGSSGVVRLGELRNEKNNIHHRRRDRLQPNDERRLYEKGFSGVECSMAATAGLEKMDSRIWPPVRRHRGFASRDGQGVRSGEESRP